MKVTTMHICVLDMKTFVIGKSITRGLLDLEWETITLSGANRYDIIEYVINSRDRFRNSLVYI